MSIEEIRARLLPKFVATARLRVTGAQAALAGSAPERIREELHALAGDAAMIGQPAIADAARSCLAYARKWSGGDVTAREPCTAGIALLAELIDALVVPG